MKIIITGTTGYVGEGNPLIRLMGQANSMREIALSMLTLTRDGYDKFAISPKDITKLAKRF